jgi:phosphoglycolate phosphatase-like HAD superfamily hydrolase
MQTPDGEPRPPRANEPLAVEGVVFDLDETLVDSCEAIAHATNAIIVPLERLRAAGPDALVPLRDVPAQIDAWRRLGRATSVAPLRP